VAPHESTHVFKIEVYIVDQNQLDQHDYIEYMLRKLYQLRPLQRYYSWYVGAKGSWCQDYPSLTQTQYCLFVLRDRREYQSPNTSNKKYGQ